MSDYVDARLHQWAAWKITQSLAPLSESQGSSDIKLYKQEVEEPRLTWCKLTDRAVRNLPHEDMKLIWLAYVEPSPAGHRRAYGWSTKDIAAHYKLSPARISQRLSDARWTISNFYEDARCGS